MFSTPPWQACWPCAKNGDPQIRLLPAEARVNAWPVFLGIVEKGDVEMAEGEKGDTHVTASQVPINKDFYLGSGTSFPLL